MLRQRLTTSIIQQFDETTPTPLTDVLPKEHDSSQVVYNIIVYPLGALIILANLMGLTYMILANFIRHPAYHYVASLAFADTGLGLYLILANLLEKPFMDRTTCLVSVCFITMLCTGSIFSILMIAVDRYIFIVYAVRYYQWVTYLYSLHLIVALWAFSAFMGFLPLMGWNTGSPAGLNCSLMNMVSRGYIIVVLLLYFTVPMLTIVVLYSRILHLVVEQRKRLLQQTRPMDALAIPRSNLYRSGIGLLRGLRTAKVVVIIVIVFVVTWLPFFIASFVQIMCGDNCHLAPTISTYLSLLGCANSLLNPCIYAYFGLNLNTKSCVSCSRVLNCLCRCRRTRVEPQISWGVL